MHCKHIVHTITSCSKCKPNGAQRQRQHACKHVAGTKSISHHKAQHARTWVVRCAYGFSINQNNALTWRRTSSAVAVQHIEDTIMYVCNISHSVLFLKLTHNLHLLSARVIPTSARAIRINFSNRTNPMCSLANKKGVFIIERRPEVVRPHWSISCSPARTECKCPLDPHPSAHVHSVRLKD